MELKLEKVEQLNPDGSTTDITNNPELWFPEMPTGKKLLALRLWQTINDKLNFYQLEKETK